MFLIGCQIHTDSRGANQRKFVQQRRHYARIPFEPIGDKLSRTDMWGDLQKGSRQMLRQPSATEDDVLPVRSKELLMKCVRSESKIRFNRCLPGTPVFRP